MGQANLAHDHVVVQRVRIGRKVETAPRVRCEGGVTILPVMDATAAMVLKEEVHFRRVQSMDQPKEQTTSVETE